MVGGGHSIDHRVFHHFGKLRKAAFLFKEILLRVIWTTAIIIFFVQQTSNTGTYYASFLINR